MDTLPAMESDRPWLISYERYNIAPTIAFCTDTLIDIFEDSFAKFDKQTAYIFHHYHLTYAELERLSRHVAGHLQSMGLQQGDTIGVVLPNWLHYPIVAIAALRAGLKLVSFNPYYTARELEHQLQDSAVKALILLDKFAPTFKQLSQPVLARIPHVIVCRYHDVVKQPLQALPAALLPKSLTKPWILAAIFGQAFIKQTSTSHSDIVQSDATQTTPTQASTANTDCKIHWWLFSELLLPCSTPYQRPMLTQQDVAVVQYTGGTTGISKGALLTHGNLLANLLQIEALLKSAYDEDGQGDIILSALPLYHVFSFTISCLLVVFKGYTGLLIDNPSDVNKMVNQIRRYPPSFILGVNPLFNALLQHHAFRQLDFSGLKAVIGGGMAISASIAKRWHSVTGMPIIEGYGLSEASPVVAFNPLTIAEFNNKVGIPAPATDILLLDEDDRPVPIGERGEIVIKGPQVIQGYHNLPQETLTAFTPQGYLRSGDIGIMDERGFLKIVDRKKDMLVVSGFNVYPAEIETVMMEHPDILECAVIGVPNPTRGEEPKIFVVTHNPNLSEAEVISFGKKNLTGYKRPRHVSFVEHIPKSAVGKILRRELRKQEGLE